jgi:ketosteroid isomerase-like protein
MDIDTVRKLDRARVSAMLKGDVEAVASYLDNDLIYIHSSGVVDTRTSYLESLSKGKFVYEAIDLIREYHVGGGDFVVLVQILSVKIRVGSTPAQQREVTANSVWRRSRQGWKLIAMQATPRAATSDIT